MKALPNEDVAYYTIQHRWTHQSPWQKPGKVEEIKEKDEWSFSSWDYFGASFDPHIGKGNDWRSRNKKAADESYDIWLHSGNKGWYTLRYAIQALRRVRKNDKNGMHDTKDVYGHLYQTLRGEFRIVKCHYSFKAEVVDLNKVEI